MVIDFCEWDEWSNWDCSVCANDTNDKTTRNRSFDKSHRNVSYCIKHSKDSSSCEKECKG